MKYLLTKSDKKTACIKDGCELKDFLVCYYSGNDSCTVWEEAQDRKSRKKQLEQLEKKGILVHDEVLVVEDGDEQLVGCKLDCPACTKLREVGA